MSGMNRRKKCGELNVGGPGADEKKISTIFIRRMIEEVFPVEIDLSASVKELKNLIHEQLGIEKENLLVDFAGVPLKDDQPLSAYGVQCSSYLHLMDKARTRGWISLFVKTPEETFPISLCCQSRLSNLKEKLFHRLNVAVKEQRIMFNGVLQTDASEKLETYGHGSTVELYVPESLMISICEVNNNRNHPMWIEDFDTGFEVKMKIFELLHIIPSAQRLFIGDVLVEDDLLMREYNISHKAVLNVHENTDAGKVIEVTVRLPWRKDINVKTDRLKSVYFLKQRIQEITENIQKQHLFLKDIELRDWMSLSESNVVNGSRIDLFVPFQIYIQTLTGKRITVTVNATDDVSILMQMVKDKEGIPLHQQRLIYGERMQMGRTLASYNIEKESIIELRLALSGC